MDKYKIMLRKLCRDDDVRELIDECRMSYIEDRENFFLTEGRYPEERDLLAKLSFDLNLTLNIMMEESKQ